MQVPAHAGPQPELAGDPQEDVSGPESSYDMLPNSMTFGVMLGRIGFPMVDLCTCLCKEVATEWDEEHPQGVTAPPSQQQQLGLDSGSQARGVTQGQSSESP